MPHGDHVDVYVNRKLYALVPARSGLAQRPRPVRVNATKTRRTAMGVQEIADRMRSRVASAGFEHSVKFDTGSDGVVVIDGATVSTADSPTDCTISLSLDDLDSLIAGDLNPTMAFMAGKLKVEGDMTVAMALSQLLG